MDIRTTPFAGIHLLQHNFLSDPKGDFRKILRTEYFLGKGISFSCRQVNISGLAKAGMIRGLFYQAPEHNETKVIVCLRGSVWLVAVDLRKDSASYQQLFTMEMTADKPKSLILGPGFAFGVQALQDDSQVLYLHDREYDSAMEHEFDPLSVQFGIAWPHALA